MIVLALIPEYINVLKIRNYETWLKFICFTQGFVKSMFRSDFMTEIEEKYENVTVSWCEKSFQTFDQNITLQLSGRNYSISKMPGNLGSVWDEMTILTIKESMLFFTVCFLKSNIFVLKWYCLFLNMRVYDREIGWQLFYLNTKFLHADNFGVSRILLHTFWR